MSENKMKRIGVLTSGGDSPGMNTAIRAVVRAALDNDIEVVGIRRGYSGLIEGETVELTAKSVSEVIARGGTFLCTARSTKFKTEEGVLEAVESCKKLGLDGLVVIGGDGSFRGASDLSKQGVPCLCIPGTIDNDISCTEYTIGFDTAVNTCVDCIDKIRDTMQSHNRCSIVEVMGRHAGYIALNAGIATGAMAILIPEVPIDIEKDVIVRMRAAMESGRHHFIIVVAEGVGNIDALAEKIKNEVGIETKTTVLGHIQRGGSPTATDRVWASRLGYEAVKLLLQGIGDRVVGVKNGEVVNYDIQEALKMTKSIDKEMYKMAYVVSTAGLERYKKI